MATSKKRKETTTRFKPTATCLKPVSDKIITYEKEQDFYFGLH